MCYYDVLCFANIALLISRGPEHERGRVHGFHCDNGEEGNVIRLGDLAEGTEGRAGEENDGIDHSFSETLKG